MYLKRKEPPTEIIIENRKNCLISIKLCDIIYIIHDRHNSYGELKIIYNWGKKETYFKDDFLWTQWQSFMGKIYTLFENRPLNEIVYLYDDFDLGDE